LAPDHEFPTGTVTFLFTDIEDSTLLWERHGEGMRPALARHDGLLRETIEAHEGRVVKTTGDGLLAVFESPLAAQDAALDAQHRLVAEGWAGITPDAVRVRMGLHRGQAQLRDGDYFGTAVNRAARIMDLAHGRQILLSGELAERVSDSLAPGITLRDLGRHPLRGLREAAHIFQLNAPGLRHDFPPLRSGATMAGNLPAHVSSFIGRTREMADIRSMLPETRLLTLTGPGGTGKSRLSLQIASDIQAQYEHGAWLVQLATVTDPTMVVETVAGIFDLSGQTPQQTHDILFDYLREKELLLILDNCEHLIRATAQLAADLIAACPELTILASSREGLGVYGETTYHLPTLSLPEEGLSDAAAINQSEAVQLFVERARTVQPHFALTDANVQAVSQVVRRLDGIPLAIELAAARLKVFSVDQIAARLDNRFRLLTGGSRTALPRQQTLRALIDWSYDLLDEEERALFRYLSVFIGGWTFEAAEQVAGSLDAFVLLPQLVDKSLVMREANPAADNLEEDLSSEPRYYFLETIRQYARDRLVEAGEVEEARDRHFSYYESLGRSLNFISNSGAALSYGAQFTLEQDNLRAAAEWGVERYPDRVLNLTWSLALVLTDQFSGARFIDWTAAALEHLETLPPAVGEEAIKRRKAHQRGMVALSLLELFLGQIDKAARRAKEASESLRDTDDQPVVLAVATFVHTQASYFLEDPSLQELANESVQMFRQLDNQVAGTSLLPMALLLAAEAAMRHDDMALAERHFNEVNTLMKGVDNRIFPWAEYVLLSMMMRIGADPEALRAQQEKAIVTLRKSRSRRLAAMAESDWAHRLRHDGDLDEALAIYQRMLVEWRDLGHRTAMANILENIAFIDRAQGRLRRAATLLGAAEQLRELAGQDMLPAEREEYEKEVRALQDTMPAEELDQQWAEGRTLPLDNLLTLVGESE
jgi:predicted ATPase/class 3 adenylate cyclase